MVYRELPTYQRDLTVKRYQLGEGYKRISKVLDTPWNTVTVITLPRTGRPSKIYEKTRRKLVREAAKRPTATLKELQKYLSSGCVVHMTTISRFLICLGYGVERQDGSLFLQRKTSKPG